MFQSQPSEPSKIFVRLDKENKTDSKIWVTVYPTDFQTSWTEVFYQVIVQHTGLISNTTLSPKPNWNCPVSNSVKESVESYLRILDPSPIKFIFCRLKGESNDLEDRVVNVFPAVK